MPDTRPTPGSIESRSAPEGLAVEGRRLHGCIPYNVESRDLGGWRETISPGALRNADLSDLVATVDHGGVPVGRYPGTLAVEDRDDGLHWSVELPESRADIREAVERGDLRSTSWRMIVGRDRWEGEVRHVEEIRSLRDVTLATTPAYPSAVAEYRTAPEPTPNTPEAVMPETPGGGLTLEDRSADDHPSIESRIVEAMAAVPKGEARSLTLASAGPVEPTDLSVFLFDQLRPVSVVLASGVRVVDTVRQKWTAPTLIGDVLADFYAESDPISETDPDFDEFTITPRSIKALVRGSSESFDDSNPDLLTIVTQNLATVLALKFDAESLVGNSTDGFKGLSLLDGRQSLTGGALENYDFYVKAAGMLQAAHVPPPYVTVMHPRVATALGLLKEWTGAESNVSLPRPSEMAQPFITSQLPIDVSTPATPTSSILVYAPAQIVCARRMDTTIEVDRSNSFDTDEVLVRAKLRASIGSAHPEAVVEVQDVVTPAIV